MTKKLLKISALCLLGIAFLVFFAIIIEPNNVYVAEGTITKMASENGVETQGNVNKYTKGFEIVYFDQVGEQRADLSEREPNHWDPEITTRLLPLHLQNKSAMITPKVYIGTAKPYVGCTVQVYYLRGAWFGDKSWFDPIADVSMCNKKAGKPPASAPAKCRPVVLSLENLQAFLICTTVDGVCIL